MTNPLEFQHSLDAKGLLCPEPLMLLHGVMRKAQSHEVIYVLATDPSTLRDITKFCVFLGHELLQTHTDDTRYEFWIRKK